jgi:hypothetical protein
MADSEATLQAERDRLHYKHGVVARVVTVDNVLKIAVKDGRVTAEQQDTTHRQGTWTVYDTAAASQAVFP